MNEVEYRVMFEVEQRHWWYLTLHDLILRFVAREFRAKGPLQMFDAGCGTGGLMTKLAAYGHVAGADLSETAVAHCRQRGLSQVSRQDLNELNLAPSSFDVITIIDVLYHDWIKSDAAVLAKLFAALKPGGLLIVNDPAFEGLRGTHDVAVLSRTRYTRPRMRHLLAQAGFRIEKLTYRVFFLFVPIALYRVVHRCMHRAHSAVETPSDVWMPRAMVNGLLRFLGRVENAMQRSVSFPFGTSVFSIARKPE